MGTQSDKNKLVEDIMPEQSISDEIIDESPMKGDYAADNNTRIPLAAHHRKHHHHHHAENNDEKAVENVQLSDVEKSSEPVREIVQKNEIEGIASSQDIQEDTALYAETEGSMPSETQEKKRIPLAAHHRKHHHSHHRSSEHRHHRSSGHRRSHSVRSVAYRSSQTYDDSQSYIPKNQTKQKAVTVSINREEFERFRHQVINDGEKDNAYEAAIIDTQSSNVITENNDMSPENESALMDNENKNSNTRLSSAILAAREENPRATRKASSIKSVGSRQRRKKATAIAVITRILIALAVLLTGSVSVLIYMRAHGQSSMVPKEEEVEIVMPEEDIPEEVEKVEDDGKTVVYKGQKYRWNDNLSTVLILGTDRTVEEQESGVTMAGLNGQADTILLGVIDNTNKKISFINVNRDTFIPVAEYTSNGDYAGEKKMQICLSYAYGKDNVTSCEYTAQAVSKYLYGMPIDSYASISYDAIPVLNDSVGGVTLTVAEDLTKTDASLSKGATITLAGNQALAYCQWRDRSIVNTNENRIARQKQYLYAFMDRTIECTRADLTLPLGLYANAKPYMTTNITASQITYMTSKVLEYGVSNEAIHSIAGQSVLGEDGHVQFNPDQTALYELVLETFYNKEN